MPRIDDILLECVFYIYPSEQDALEGSEFGGSGFFYIVQSEVVTDRGFLYAVTNAHCIFGSKYDPVLRINTIDGNFDTISTQQKDWKRHPDGDDLAVCLIGLDESRHSIGRFDIRHIATKEFIEGQNIGPGDEVIMIGRFHSFAGEKKNLPTARFGNIAMMPDEPIKNSFTGLKHESYLVEMRSVSGFSGSPVVVYIPPMSDRQEKGSQHVRSLGSMQRLLGIDWGHIQHKEMVLDQSENMHPDKLHILANSAMAGVVPAWKLLELLDSDEVAKVRKEIDEKKKKEMETSDFALDASDKQEGEQEFTKEDFDNALKKIARPLKSQDDEGKSET